MVYNSNVELQAKYNYDAFGNATVCNPDGTVNTSTTFIGNLNPIRYKGYYFDTETNLYYLQSRYYDSETGRFISPDDVSFLDPNTIGGMNLYAYCLNNPVMLTDSTGCSSFWSKFCVALTGIASVGAIIAGTVLIATGVGAVVGTVLLAGGIGGVASITSSVISQGITNGWNNINWGVVAFDGIIGMAAGAMSAIPGLNFIGSIAIGAGAGFIGSIGGDLITSGKIDWGKAITMTIVGGVLGGVANKIGSIVNKGVGAIGEIMGHGSNFIMLTAVSSKEILKAIAVNSLKIGGVGIATTAGLTVLISWLFNMSK